MLVDCLFLSYLLGGTMKWVRTKHGDRIPPLRDLEDFEITRSQNPQKVAGQLYRDFTLSHDITFSCFTLDRGRGRKPRARQLLRSVPARASSGRVASCATSDLAPRRAHAVEGRPWLDRGHLVRNGGSNVHR